MEKTILSLLIFLIVLGILAGLMLYFFFPPVNTSDLLSQIFEKAGKVKEIGISYSLSYSSFSDGTETTGEGSLDFIYANGNSKSVFKLQATPYSYFLSNSSEFVVVPPYYSRIAKFEIYSLPEGNIACAQTSVITQKYECIEIEPSKIVGDYPFGMIFQPNLKEWLEKNIINASYLGKKEFINRKCDYFKFDVDISKLTSYIAGISIRSKNASFVIFSCFDEETGFMLFHSYEIVYNYSYGSYSYRSGSRTSFEAKNLSLEVDETQIKLPVPLNQVQWLPRFEIIETLCQENSREIKIAIQSIKDLPQGSATLNISTTQTYTNYPHVQVNGYNHHCFSLSDIFSGTSVTFTFSSINDTYTRYFIIGIDCSEAHGKNLYPSYSYECEYCSKGGKYCSMGTYRYPTYYFSSDLPGNHEICVWPNSPSNSTWQLDKVEIRKRVQHSTKSDFEGMKKGEIKVLSFSVPFAFKRDDYYTLTLEIGGSKSSGYCYPSMYRPPVALGFFTKILEKIINITQAT